MAQNINRGNKIVTRQDKTRTLAQYIMSEVYGGKKRNIVRKFYYRYIYSHTNAQLLVRKMLFCKNEIKKIYYRELLHRRYGILINRYLEVGMGFRLLHPMNVVIGGCTTIGENVQINQGVTIGSRIPLRLSGKADHNTDEYPTIGDNCIICTNAVVLGGIKLAKGTVVAAGAVLMTDTEPNSVYAGVPAKRVK
jgi:serine O-acetyltransferase